LNHRVLIDAREFTPGRVTGITKVLQGLIITLAQVSAVKEIVLVTSDPVAVSEKFSGLSTVRVKSVPPAFFASEKILSTLTRATDSLFLSPYPKLPLFGSYCTSVHTIHDVLDLTHAAYRRRLKALFDGYRLRKALRNATLTWYDSGWSLKETERYAGFVGKDPRVRYPAIDPGFSPTKITSDEQVLSKYGLHAGYILAVGNGMPHKNLGVLLQIAPQTDRRLLFVGVPSTNEVFWMSRFPAAKVSWIPYVQEEELPAIMRAAFCLAQPSTAEGYGYPPLEAMACGVPAVVSDIPVLRETTGGNALEADPRRPQAWLEAFRALGNAAIYQTQVSKGQGWVEPLRGTKGWQRHVSDIEELLKERS
jgi:glycosyltransferase involved in cell wall biosynthesis